MTVTDLREALDFAESFWEVHYFYDVPVLRAARDSVLSFLSAPVRCHDCDPKRFAADRHNRMTHEPEAQVTNKQRARQRHRDRSGRYEEVYPCQRCNQSAGVEPLSDRRTDTVDSVGNSWGDVALTLCGGCAAHLSKLGDGEAFAEMSVR